MHEWPQGLRTPPRIAKAVHALAEENEDYLVQSMCTAVEGGEILQAQHAPGSEAMTAGLCTHLLPASLCNGDFMSLWLFACECLSSTTIPRLCRDGPP
jgi:hypothetical protein